jgi:cephalosporin hydroxylase
LPTQNKPKGSIVTPFEIECAERVAGYAENAELKAAAHQFLAASTVPKYSYNFAWMGRPIIQYPQDIVAMQEVIWRVKPDLIIETGIAHGGSLIFSASMLALLELVEATEKSTVLDPAKPKRRVVGVDIDIRAHNRTAIEAHPMAGRIDMIQGSSIAESTIQEVHRRARGFSRVLVCLDSNHTHAHVLAELKAYADLTSVGSYCVVFDTMVEDLPAAMFEDKIWSPGDNPKTAVHAFLKTTSNFEIDRQIDNKILISVAPDGYLKRVN